MTWDSRRADRRRTALDDTVICRVDNLLRNAHEDRDRLRADVSALDDEVIELRAWKRRRIQIDMAIGALVVIGTLAACAIRL